MALAPSSAPHKSNGISQPTNVIVSTNPATGATLGSVPITPINDIPAMLARARKTQESWQALGLKKRLKIMRRLRYVMHRHTDEILDMLVAEVGRPRFEALIEFWPALELLTHYLRIAPNVLAPEHITVALLPQRIHWVEKHPYGVVLVIAPWNFPLLLSVTPIFAALIAGNSVIYKPSENATQMGELIAKLIWEAGVPPSVFQIAHGAGEVGAALVKAKPDRIVFTGSPATGRKIAAAAAELLIPTTLELGGKDAAIVLEDADIDRTATALVWSGMLNAGQACLSVERIYARREIADRLVQTMAQVIRRHVRVGDGADPQHTLGAITTESQMAIIDNHVQEALQQGARAVFGGGKMAGSTGRFYLPTLLTDVKPTMRVVTEETFGPVIAVVPVASDEEAIREANRSAFGLTGSVWTRNRNRGIALARRMRVGHASVNDHIISASTPNVPWGGVGESGYGRTRGREGLLEMAYLKAISVERFASLPREIFWYPYTPFKYKLLRRVIDLLYAEGLLAKLNALFKPF